MTPHTGRHGRRSHGRVLQLALAAAIGLVLAGCAAATPDSATGTASNEAPADGVAAQAEGRVIIDVRTPEEFEAGHVEGAQLIDIQQPDFEARVSQLPRDEAYFVYCRTGNRSGQAIERMRDLGFTDLVNGGGFAELADAGLPTSIS